ncbi:KH domain-containing protein [Alicyclobacillus fastidiosus]|uniref:RNA-binding protein KhpA n=1 Tax=Alicyclobacillus fastidiosus TaxID=392011 RepID=A0ABV5AGW9_9BACL|nr:KH domain-containing protein [Alicyclobacillus fastidiosus]WEH08051.1 KH domain-containing protein [Alicyclobacillus fastidiosus]
MKELVQYLVSSLVDHPDAVEVVEVPDNGAITYRVKVHAEDMGRVIGRQGRIAKAIRNVVSAAAYRQKQRVFVDIQS